MKKTPTVKHRKKKTMAAWTTDPGSWQGDRSALTPLAILLALTGGLTLYATLEDLLSMLHCPRADVQQRTSLPLPRDLSF